MIWIIRKELLKATLLDQDGKPAALLRCRNGSYRIFSPNDELLYTMTADGSLSLSISGKENGFVRIKLCEPPVALIPPRAVEALLTLEKDTFRMTQNSKRSFELYHLQARIGQINNIFSYRVALELHAELAAERVALLYALAQRMLCEDDIDIV